MVVPLTMVVVMAGLDASLRPFKGGNVKRLKGRISRFWRTRVKIGMRCPGTCRHMPSCTLWCWVLSDLSFSFGGICLCGLNAPSGAECFLTGEIMSVTNLPKVLMHLLVLSAF